MAIVKKRTAALSLTEIVISLFLISFVALSILSMFQTGFSAQKRTMRANRASFITQTLVTEIRLWAKDYNNYSSSWTPYNRTFPYPDDPTFTVTVRAQPGASPLYSPSAELESQWEIHPKGARIMPTAVVPVEIEVAWSTAQKDRLETFLYVGEPWRDPTGATAVVTGPNPGNLSVGSTSTVSMTLQDSSNRPFENLLATWKVDSRYLQITSDSPRDGRSFKFQRKVNPPNPPYVPPPVPPALSPVQCYAQYAGDYMPIVGGGVALP